ncbi:MAG: SRPBCC domain-containing protein [Myxococcales bacterium]|nr:SRPBCC domain-containing protein [Myxococcales bacterium]
MAADDVLQVTVTRRIRAPIARVFAAWTQPAHLLSWWGPTGVACVQAEVDLRVGGRYLLANRMPTGDVVRIEGVFEQIEPERRLVYTWSVDGRDSGQRVTVRFVAHGAQTDVHVVHERIPTEPERAGHEAGWIGCLQGLATHLGGAAP